MFLVDEISLADDSVLERLNSVLEPERTLVLAEKGGGDGARNEVEQIFANETFRIVATMNPGGDYGKKEVGDSVSIFDYVDMTFPHLNSDYPIGFFGRKKIKTTFVYSITATLY